MRKLFLIGFGVAVVFLTLVVGSDRYLARHTVKIDDKVSLVTLDEYVVVMQAGEKPRVTRVKPDVTLPKNVQVTPTDIRPKQPLAAKPVPPPATIKWTLPYSCADVRYYSSHFSQTQLDAMRKAAGMALPTAEQRAQIQACLAGKIK